MTPSAAPRSEGSSGSRGLLFALVAAARGRRSAILWLYDRGYRPGTAAAARRLAMTGTWRCRAFPRAEGRGVLACAPL